MILDPTLNLARKSTLASVGVVALIGDKLANTFDRFATRGEQLQAAAKHGYVDIIKRPEQTATLNKQRLTQLRGTFQQGRDRLIAALNLPTQSSIEQLNTEVARLSAQIDQIRAAARNQTRAANEAQAIPLPGYDKLNAERVIELLPTIAAPQLLTVQRYEQTHGNRVTVLRAINKLIEAQAAG